MWLFSRHGTRYPRNDPEPGGEDRANEPAAREMELDALTTQMPILRDQVLRNHMSGHGILRQTTIYDKKNRAFWFDISQS